MSKFTDPFYNHPYTTAAFFIAALYFVPKMLQTDIQYRVDEWCLEHQIGAVEFESDYPSPTSLTNAPRFNAPSAFSTMTSSDDPEATGLSVKYRKLGVSNYQFQIDRRRRAVADGCIGDDYGNGLVEYIDNSTEPVKGPVLSSPCRTIDGLRKFVTTGKHPDTETIIITCNIRPSVVGCNMRDVMPSGWEANIALSKENLADWKQARDDARAFFENSLKDCGDKL